MRDLLECSPGLSFNPSTSTTQQLSISTAKFIYAAWEGTIDEALEQKIKKVSPLANPTQVSVSKITRHERFKLHTYVLNTGESCKSSGSTAVVDKLRCRNGAMSTYSSQNRRSYREEKFS